MRKEDPTAYIRMIASLVPKQVVDTAPNPLEHLTMEELEQLETYLESIANKGESGPTREANGHHSFVRSMSVNKRRSVGSCGALIGSAGEMRRTGKASHMRGPSCSLDPAV